MMPLTRRFLLAFHCQTTRTRFPQKKQPGAFIVRNWDFPAVTVKACPFSSSISASHQDDTATDDDNDKDNSDKNKDKIQRMAERREREWNKRFEILKAYADEMRKKYPDDKYLPFPRRDFKLFFWFTNQRYLYQQTVAGEIDDEKDAMSDEQIWKLESLGFMLTPRDDYWELRFEQLVEFLKQNDGRFPYEMDYDQFNKEEKRLYWWCQNQKKRYSLYHRGQQKGIVSMQEAWTPEREKRLAEIGFCWNTKEAQWNMRFEELKAYRAHHGNCLVPVEYAPNKPLAVWVGEQRAHYRRMKNGVYSSMTAERVELLESIGFAWNAPDARWLMRYQELEAHVDLNGPGILPMSKSSPRRWLDRQLKLLREMRKGKRNSMTEKRAKLLAKLGYA